MSLMWSTCSMSTGHCSTHALGAGGEVQHPLPGEVLDLAAAEDVVLARVLEVDGLAVAHHRLQRAERRGAVHLTLEVHVQERAEPVPRDAHVEHPGDRDQPD